jgi:hypothetical protein
MAELTKNEKILCDLLWSLKYDEKKVSVPNDRENAIIIACLVARQYNCTGEMLEIVLKNKDKSLDEVINIITHQKFFPEPPEIVDDDELDDDEK